MSDTSFTRWQGRTREQMGYAINTLLVLATGTIGFAIAKLLEGKLYCYARCFAIVGCGLLFLCIMVLLLLIVNRLIDFRLTTQIARKRETKKRDGIERDREESRRMGNRTWSMFYFALASFLLGEVFIIIGFAIQIL